MFLYLIPSLTPLFHKQFNLSYIISAARDSVSLPTLKLWFLPLSLVTKVAIVSIQPYVSGNWCHWELTSEASKEVSFHSSQLSDMVCCMDVWALRTGSSERMRKKPKQGEGHCLQWQYRLVLGWADNETPLVLEFWCLLPVSQNICHQLLWDIVWKKFLLQSSSIICDPVSHGWSFVLSEHWCAVQPVASCRKGTCTRTAML